MSWNSALVTISLLNSRISRGWLRPHDNRMPEFLQSRLCHSARPDQGDAKGHPRFLGGRTWVAPDAPRRGRGRLTDCEPAVYFCLLMVIVRLANPPRFADNTTQHDVAGTA